MEIFENLPKIPLGWNDLMLFIVSLILYWVLRDFKQTKQTIEKNINISNDHWYKEMDKLNQAFMTDLNEAYRILDIKIRYVDFRVVNQDMENDEFIKALNSNGFSREDLEVIGVDDKFLKENHDKLMPRKVIDAYQNFKKALKEHTDIKKDENKSE